MPEAPRKNARFELVELAGEAVLYDTDRHDVVYLNPWAVLVWHLCDGERTVDDIIGLLVAAYPDSEQAVRLDVPALIADLRRHGALDECPSPPIVSEPT